MDFRVTHFLVAANAQTTVSTATLSSITNGTLALYKAFKSDNVTPIDSASAPYSSTGSALTVPFYFAQGLDRTDAIEKELGIIKSGIINPSKIVSVRKVIGSDVRSRQVKFFGTVPTHKFYTGSPAATSGGTGVTAAAGTFYSSATGSQLYYCVLGGATAAALSTTAPGAVGSMYKVGAASFIYMGTLTSSPLALAQFAAPSTTTGSFEIDADKEYSFSVRVRSAKANAISPFGLTRGYSSGPASSVFVNPTNGVSQSNNAYAPFSVMFNLVKAASADPMLTEFAKLSSYMTLCKSTNNTVTDHVIFTYDDTITTSAKLFMVHPTDALITTPMPIFMAPSGSATADLAGAVVINVKNYATWNDALAAGRALSSGFYTPTLSAANTIAGQTYTASLILEGLDQTNFNLTYSPGVTDLTAYPFKFDYVRLNGYFLEGPYGQSLSYVTGSNNVLPINAGVSTQTPITFDKTQSGLISVASILSSGTYVANSVTFLNSGMVLKYNTTYSFEDQIKFPNLLKEEVRHIAHQYQSYSLKYKQQFNSPRYNAMVMDPFQNKIDAAGPYTLYYIEYLPEVDTAYTSTQSMTNLTIIAVPTSNTAVTGYINALVNETTETAS